MAARFSGDHAGLRSAVLDALLADADLAPRVSYDPPDLMAAAPDAGQAGRIYVGFGNGRVPSAQRGYREGDAVLATAVLAVHAWSRRQPTDKIRTSTSTEHSYDTALKLVSALTRVVVGAGLGFREVSHVVLAEGNWYQVQLQITLDWDFVLPAGA